MAGIRWHMHHIIPRHVGGADDPSNIIRVNTAMHVFLHKCLFEEYGRTGDYVAWKAMSSQIGKDEIMMERAKMGGAWHKGKKKPEGFAIGSKNSHYGKKHTIESKLLMSKGLLGRKHSEEEKQRRVMAQIAKRNYLFEATSPDGTKYTDIENLTKFCKENGLNQCNMSLVIKGINKQHKGWICSRVLKIKENSIVI